MSMRHATSFRMGPIDQLADIFAGRATVVDFTYAIRLQCRVDFERQLGGSEAAGASDHAI